MGSVAGRLHVVDRARRWIAHEAPPSVRSAADVFARLAREWRDDRVTGLAAEIAFYGVLSLLPAFLAIAVALGSLQAVIGADAARHAESEMLSFLQRILTDEASGTITAVRRLFTGDRPGMLTFSAAGAVWALSRAFSGIIDALAVVYDVEERRTWLRRRGLALVPAGISIVVAALVVAAVVVGPLFGSGRDVADLVGLGDTFVAVWTWVRWPAIAVGLALWALAIYHFGPNQQAGWLADVPGAVLAMLSWVAVSLGFSTYLSYAGRANAVLGALGGALIFLVWLYLLALGLLLGGQLNAVLAARARALTR